MLENSLTSNKELDKSQNILGSNVHKNDNPINDPEVIEKKPVEQKKVKGEKVADHKNETKIVIRGKDYYFPIANADLDMFNLKETRSKSQVKRDYNTTVRTLDSYKTDLNKTVKYEDERRTQVNYFKNLSSKLARSSLGFKYLWKHDSPEMERVKKTVNYLNNLLDCPVSRYMIAEEKRLDLDRMRDEFSKAFDAVTDACKNYLNLKKEQNQAKHKGGINRKKMVGDINNRCTLEKQKYMSVIEGLKDKERSFEDYSDNDKISELTTKHVVLMAEETEFQNEGNSTDVYKIRVKGKDGEEDQYYYIKENLPLISDDIEGFVERRLDQLKISKEAHNNNNTQDEEARLVKSELESTEYDLAIKFFETLKKTMDVSDPNEKIKAKEKVLSILGHDFDKMFEELQDYNNAVKLVQDGNSIQDLNSIANNPRSLNAGGAKYLLRLINNNLKEETEKEEAIIKAQNEARKNARNKKNNKAAAKNGAEVVKRTDINKAFSNVAKQLNYKSKYDWMIEKLKLDAASDTDLIKVLDDAKTASTKATEKAKHKRIDPDNAGEEILVDVEWDDNMFERLFRISAGKEVELYGQIKDRTGAGENEIAASKNIATGALAAKMGFEDEITSAGTKIVHFKDRTGKIRSAFCTVCEEAKGIEFIDIMKNAQKEGKEIHYTPEATRQLMRLQAFDLVCRQVDRHGRNFKCVLDEEKKKEGKYVIKSIKAYDHDQSFGDKDLKDLIEGKNEGFLQGLTKKYKKDDPMYRYIREKYFGLSPKALLEKAKMPDVKISGSASVEDDLRKRGEENLIMLWRYGEDFTDNFNAAGYIFKRNKDFDDKKTNFRQPYEFFKAGMKELDENEMQAVWSKELQPVLQNIRDILKPVNPNLKGRLMERKLRDANTLTKKEKTNLLAEIQKLIDLNEKYDFRYINMDHQFGHFDFWIQSVIFTYLQFFSNDKEMQYDLYETREEKRIAEIDEKLKVEEAALKKLTDKKDIKDAKKRITDLENEKKNLKDGLQGKKTTLINDFDKLLNKDKELEVPSLLHFDYDAYVSIKAIANANDLDDLKATLKNMNIEGDDVLAIQTRCKQLIDYLDEAEKKAKIFYKLAGWSDDKTDVRGQFYLKKDDYSKITDLSELSVDPGSTYLSIDNENYLFGDKKYFDLVDDTRKSTAAGNEMRKQKDPKRWNNRDHVLELVNSGNKQKLIRSNPLKSSIIKAS